MPRGRPRRPVDPQTPEEWQEAVNAAHFCLLVDSCRQYGLVETDMAINQARCEELLERGKALGYTPHEEEG